MNEWIRLVRVPGGAGSGWTGGAGGRGSGQHVSPRQRSAGALLPIEAGEGAARFGAEGVQVSQSSIVLLLVLCMMLVRSLFCSLFFVLFLRWFWFCRRRWWWWLPLRLQFVFLYANQVLLLLAPLSFLVARLDSPVWNARTA